MPRPIDLDCCHAPSDAERARDRGYLGCSAKPGEACIWGKRWDGVADPPFHTERLEAAAMVEPHSGQITDDAFDRAVLESQVLRARAR